jgi:hypothetical protein
MGLAALLQLAILTIILSDNCGIASTSVSQSAFDCSHVGGNTVTLTVNDVNGNASTCNATVTVQDNVDPTANCQNTTVQLDAGGSAALTAGDIDNNSEDNCAIASTSISQSAFDCSNVGANTVTLTVNDVNGNSSTCSATVTVQDNVNPTANCQNTTVQLDANGAASIAVDDIDNNSEDNCAIASTSISQSNFDCSHVGANTVTLTVNDVNGNASTCNATVTVQDNVNPTANCQNTTIQLDAGGSAALTAGDIDNNSEDNCAIASTSISQSAFDCSHVGANTVTLTVNDVNGNSSTCNATVTVQDNVDPTANCQNTTIQLDAGGSATLTAGDIDNNSEDNCAIASTSISQSAFDCSHVGANTVTLTVNDVNGNASTCNATVTVQDNVNPQASCLNTAVTFNGEPGFQIPVDLLYDAAGSTDNCGVVNLVSPLDGAWIDCADVGSTVPVTIEIQDANGNPATCTAYVTVDGLPCGWRDMGGINCYDGNNTSTFDGVGQFDIWANNCAPAFPFTAESTGFVFTELCGDGEIIAEVTNVQGTGYAGVMMRNEMNPSSPMVAMGSNRVNRIQRQVRVQPGYPAWPQQVLSFDKFWVRLVRNGNQFQGFASVDGVSWIPYLNQSVFMDNNCLHVGLYAYSEKPGNSLSASFNNVYVTGQSSAIAQQPQGVAYGASIAQELTVNVYPNPANNMIQVELSVPDGQQVEYQLRNTLGQPVLQKQTAALRATRGQLDVSGLMPGVYYLVVRTDGQQVTKHLVIAR